MLDITKIKLKRRTLLKKMGAAGVVTTFTPFAVASALEEGAQPTIAPAMRVSDLKPSDFQTFRSTCAMECLHCNLTAYVNKGKLIKVEASNDFNVKGCLRGISRTKWVNHKQRLTTPLLRTGEKGKGEFKPISWDEALDLLESKIKETIAAHGNEGIFLSTASGNMDSIKNDTAKSFFEYMGGCTLHRGSLCCSAVTAAMMPIVGGRYIDTRDTIADSRYILCWGNNPAVTMQAYFKELGLT